MKAIKSFYLSTRFFIVTAALVFLFVLSYFSPPLLVISNLLFAVLVFLLISDTLILFINKKGIYSYRQPQTDYRTVMITKLKYFLKISMLSMFLVKLSMRYLLISRLEIFLSSYQLKQEQQKYSLTN